MALIHAYRSRGLTRDITIEDADGEAIVVGDNDEIRAMIGREGAAVLLTVASDAPTAAGSSFTPNSPSSGLNRLRLDATDLAALAAGIYTLYVDYYDNADAAEWKNVSRQIFSLEESEA